MVSRSFSLSVFQSFSLVVLFISLVLSHDVSAQEEGGELACPCNCNEMLRDGLNLSNNFELRPNNGCLELTLLIQSCSNRGSVTGFNLVFNHSSDPCFANKKITYIFDGRSFIVDFTAAAPSISLAFPTPLTQCSTIIKTVRICGFNTANCSNDTYPFTITTFSDKQCSFPATIHFPLSAEEKEFLVDAPLVPNPSTRSTTLNISKLGYAHSQIERVVLRDILGNSKSVTYQITEETVFIETQELSRGIFSILLESVEGEQFVVSQTLVVE